MVAIAFGQVRETISIPMPRLMYVGGGKRGHRLKSWLQGQQYPLVIESKTPTFVCYRPYHAT